MHLAFCSLPVGTKRRCAGGYVGTEGTSQGPAPFRLQPGTLGGAARPSASAGKPPAMQGGRGWPALPPVAEPSLRGAALGRVLGRRPGHPSRSVPHSTESSCTVSTGRGPGTRQTWPDPARPAGKQPHGAEEQVQAPPPCPHGPRRTVTKNPSCGTGRHSPGPGRCGHPAGTEAQTVPPTQEEKVWKIFNFGGLHRSHRKGTPAGQWPAEGHGL